MKWSVPIGRVNGISLRLHVTFLIFLVFIAYSGLVEAGFNGAYWAVVMFSSIFGCIILHELGHSLVAQQLGVQVKSITLLPIGGVAALRSIPENPWHEIAITVAGPMVNAAIGCILIPFTGIPSHWLIVGIPENLHELLECLVQANVTLFLFNLIPAFPMDGGRLLRAVLALALPYARATTAAAMVGQGLAILFVVAGLKFSFWLVLIGAFIFFGAEGEERVVRMRGALRNLRVADVMNRDVVILSPTDPLSRGVELLYQTGQDDFPVVDAHLVGLVTRSALVEAMNTHPPDTPIANILDTDVIISSPEARLLQACDGIINGTNPKSVVVVDDGQLAGMVSAENINRYLGVWSNVRSSRRRRRSEQSRPPQAVPPRLATWQTPTPPPVISGAPPIASPQSHGGSGRSSGLL